MTEKHLVDRTHLHPLFDRALPPVLTVNSGDEVTFETLDACWGLVRSVEDFVKYRRDASRISNPITGPVYVRERIPGGSLVVEILTVELDATGFQLIGPNRGVIRDESPDWECQVVRVRDGKVVLSNGITLPAAPVIGQLGNAPSGEATNLPNPFGGNLDVPQIRPGAKVFLPIAVDGALFSLGDVHACQGDGEIAGAAEIGGRVTVRLSVLNSPSANWPLVVHGDIVSLVATAASEAEAIRVASEAARWIAANHGVRFNDAMMLLTLIAEIRCSRTGFTGAHGPVVAVSFAKSVVAAALASVIKPPTAPIARP